MNLNHPASFSAFWASIPASLFIFCAAFLTSTLFMILSSTQVVGDGDEYYAMFVAITETVKPWMSEDAYLKWDYLADIGDLNFLPTSEQLQARWAVMSVNDTNDFNHFWFYSLCAAFLKLTTMGALGDDPHLYFITLHVLLIASSAAIAFHWFRWSGIIALLLVLVFSPVFWYWDKVHTELFTVVIGCVGVFAFLRERYLLSSLFIAVISTQNISFAALAFIPFVFAFIDSRNEESPFSKMLWMFIPILILLHPAYYFFRHGVVTPQLIYGADIDQGFQYWWVSLFEPDVGLVWHWPLGIMFTIIAGVTFLRNARKHPLNTINWRLGSFIFAWVVLCISASMVSTNLNSGASLGMSRYALWFVPLFLVPILAVLGAVNGRPNRIKLGIYALIALIAAPNIWWHRPIQRQEYQTPTRVSQILQNSPIKFYTPPVEIFMERYSGIGEGIYFSGGANAVVGPACDRIGLRANRTENSVLAPIHCHLDIPKIVEWLNAEWDRQPRIVYFEPAQFAITPIAPNEVKTLSAYSLRNVLDDGWHETEAWGAWTDGKRASLKIMCNVNPGRYRMEMVLRSFHVRHTVTISIGDDLLWTGDVLNFTPIKFVTDYRQCQSGYLNIQIRSNGSVAPSEVMDSQDTRNLGVGIKDFIYQFELQAGSR